MTQNTPPTGAFGRWISATRALDAWIVATRGLSAAIGAALALALGELAGVVDIDWTAISALAGGN